MKELTFTIDIRAPKSRVWDTLWQDVTFREWTGLIDPGTYMKGELKEGNELEFISAENGYGVTSLVSKLVDGEHVLLKHQADTQNSGQDERVDEWTGGSESYTLAENDGITTLTITFDVPVELEEIMNESCPKAMERIKSLTERT